MSVNVYIAYEPGSICAEFTKRRKYFIHLYFNALQHLFQSKIKSGNQKKKKNATKMMKST